MQSLTNLFSGHDLILTTYCFAASRLLAACLQAEVRINTPANFNSGKDDEILEMVSLFAKLTGELINPINLIIIFLVVGFALICFKQRRLGFTATALGLVYLILATHTPLGNIIVLPLEERFKKANLPMEIAGIICLGGSFENLISLERNVTEFANASERLYETFLLARKFPNAQIVYTGTVGSPDLANGDTPKLAKTYWVSLGIDEHRIVLEQEALNTYENGVFTKKLINPKPGENWVLVTSAFHMPRSIGVFRKLDWEVLPWPVDYRTHGTAARFDFSYDEFINLSNIALANKEWFGLFAYYIIGRSSSVFPAPG